MNIKVRPVTPCLRDADSPLSKYVDISDTVCQVDICKTAQDVRSACDLKVYAENPVTLTHLNCM